LLGKNSFVSRITADPLREWCEVVETPEVTDDGSHDVTRMLQDWNPSSAESQARLMPVVYTELRRLARHYLRKERSDHTLQATDLVHEAYLRLVDQTRVTWQSRAHFYGVAAQLMRRILVDHARARSADKRGGASSNVPFEDARLYTHAEESVDLLALDHALLRLEQFDARKARVVELRFFGGLNEDETAEFLGVSTKTVKRDWQVAKLWLYSELAETKAGN
jgi:RNA polymerase sigma-70 factor (ECF subfamily)